MPSASKAPRDLDERLNALIEVNPELADAVAFYRKALIAMGSVREHLPAGGSSSAGLPEAEEIRARMSHGLPALAIEQMQFPIDDTRTLLYDLCCILEEQVSDNPQPDEEGEPGQAAWRAESAHRIRTAIEAGEVDIPRVLRAAARGDVADVGAEALRNHLDADMLRTLAHNSIRPVLQQWSELAAPEVALQQWQRGTCPICGSVPALGELPPKGPGRHLRCGRCGARWEYPREQCAFCGNSEPASLTVRADHPVRMRERFRRVTSVEDM